MHSTHHLQELHRRRLLLHLPVHRSAAVPAVLPVAAVPAPAPVPVPAPEAAEPAVLPKIFIVPTLN